MYVTQDDISVGERKEDLRRIVADWADGRKTRDEIVTDILEHHNELTEIDDARSRRETDLLAGFADIAQQSVAHDVKSGINAIRTVGEMKDYSYNDHSRDWHIQEISHEAHGVIESNVRLIEFLKDQPELAQLVQDKHQAALAELSGWPAEQVTAYNLMAYIQEKNPDSDARMSALTANDYTIEGDIKLQYQLSRAQSEYPLPPTMPYEEPVTAGVEEHAIHGAAAAVACQTMLENLRMTQDLRYPSQRENDDHFPDETCRSYIEKTMAFALKPQGNPEAAQKALVWEYDFAVGGIKHEGWLERAHEAVKDNAVRRLDDWITHLQENDGNGLERIALLESVRVEKHQDFYNAVKSDESLLRSAAETYDLHMALEPKVHPGDFRPEEAERIVRFLSGTRELRDLGRPAAGAEGAEDLLERMKVYAEGRPGTTEVGNHALTMIDELARDTKRLVEEYHAGSADEKADSARGLQFAGQLQEKIAAAAAAGKIYRIEAMKAEPQENA